MRPAERSGFGRASGSSWRAACPACRAACAGLQATRVAPLLLLGSTAWVLPPAAAGRATAWQRWRSIPSDTWKPGGCGARIAAGRVAQVQVQALPRLACAAPPALQVSVAPRLHLLCPLPHHARPGRYAIGGIGAVCHTLNPRLFEDDLQYIINHAQVLFILVCFKVSLGWIGLRHSCSAGPAVHHQPRPRACFCSAKPS